MLRLLTFICLLLCLASCKAWTPAPSMTNRPVVHQGWDARYRYDVEKRRLHPYFSKRRVGKSVGRDEKGNENYKVWWRNQVFYENLLKKKP
ncbi:MAG: hypothetical protein CMI30_12720 [Opitutae bacterium]|nr:hypothetical protein [Opitutae bacterium]